MNTTPAAVIGLDRSDARRLPLVGGKAASLSELIAAGFAVPGGFCVTTPAYTQAATAAGLDQILRGSTAADPTTLGERARAVLLAAPVPAEVAAAVASAYANLGADPPVAVRSSATAEDLPWASFAGQQDTYLNIVGVDAVLDAVRRCWASLWTDRAVSYRSSAGIDHRTVALAVVVQRMVDAQVAGVLFTADPVTGRRTRTVIDASPGLGEAVVSGAVNPDHVVVEGDGTITEHRLGDKAVQVRALPGGGTEQVAGITGAGQPCLSEPQIHELVALGRRVEAHCGAPQDIEWALDGAGALWLTQSRPITTLHPLPPPTGDGLRVYLCVSLAQGLTRPMTPMGVSAFRVIASTGARKGFGVPVADPVAGPPALTVAGGRLFVDITPVLRSSVGRTVVPRVLDVMEARSAVVLRALFDEPALAVHTTSRRPAARRVLRVLVRYRVPLLLAQALLRPAAARRRVDRVGDRLRTLTEVPAGADGRQRLQHVERVLSAIFPIMPTVAPVAGAGLAMLALVRKLSGADLDEAASHEVLRSLPHNTTTEMDLELWALATRVRADSDSAAALGEVPPTELAARFGRAALPPVLQHGLGEFLRRHGHRAVAEIDLGMPRWSDDPTHVLGVLANYLRLDDPARAPDAQFARGARAADAAVVATVARVRRRSRLRALAVGGALRRVRQLAGMRETHKDFLVRLLAHARAELATVGTELAGRRLLADADDVFFLHLTEARSALAGADHRVTVAARRESYRQELRRRHVPRILLSDGTEPEALATPDRAAAAGALTGTPASAGTVTAAARVVLDPVGAHLEPGEILVAPSTDPGWTPLFLTAGGLVMEMGGPNSHGAVVAREYGIPAVVGVPDATVRITTGTLITVDGAAGLVRPANPLATPSADGARITTAAG
ncbi:MAG: PEP/pyruvate-binding domain-containing protein [Pseudonocardia sp.]